jgi:hypothetical protein
MSNFILTSSHQLTFTCHQTADEPRTFSSCREPHAKSSDLYVGGTVLAQLSQIFVGRVRPSDARPERSGGSVSHWICANRNSKTSTRLSTRPFHSPWSEPAPAPDLLAGIGRSPGDQNRFERSHPNAG